MQSFRHDVRELMSGSNMQHLNVSQSNLVADKVNVNLYMLRAVLVDWVSFMHVHSTDMVAVDDRRLREGCMKLLKKLTKPTCLSHSMCNNMLLSLRAQTGDYGMVFGGPRH